MNKLTMILFLSILISGTSQASLILTPPPSNDLNADADAPVSFGGFPADRGGIVVGNGGFTVQCSENGPLQSYDFLAIQNKMGKAFKVRPVNYVEDSLASVGRVIRAKLPALAPSFDIFMSEILSGDDSGTYVWRQGSPWLFDDTLPGDVSHFVMPCGDAQDPIPYSVRQVIVRKYVETYFKPQVVLEYDGLLYYGLPGVQRSFLLVHEWLWNFTKDNEANSMADYLLHSVEIEKMSSEKVIQEFKRLGLRYPKQ